MIHKPRILFLCVHNSARSQIAEALVKKYAGNDFDAYSGGIEPGQLNHYVVKVLQEDEGIDISNNRTKSAFEFVQQGILFQYVVTVCDESTAQKCPIFPGVKERIIMSFEDPRIFKGSKEEILKKVQKVKEEIKSEVFHLIELIKNDQLTQNFPSYWKLG